jgi:hypothetical protein
MQLPLELKQASNSSRKVTASMLKMGELGIKLHQPESYDPPNRHT